MSDERKEILKHFNEITREYHQHCEWTAAKYWAVEKIRELLQQKPLDDKWLPTVKNIDALPEPIRKYIHDLEANCDPAGMIQANTIMRDLCNQLEAKLIQQKPEIDDHRDNYAVGPKAMRHRLNSNIRIGDHKGQKPEIDEKCMQRWIEDLEESADIETYEGIPSVIINKEKFRQIISDVKGQPISKENLKISEAKTKEK